MSDYLNKIKSLYSILTSHPSDDLDIINIAIDGLGIEYNRLVDSLYICDSMAFSQMYHLLVEQERALKRWVDHNVKGSASAFIAYSLTIRVSIHLNVISSPIQSLKQTIMKVSMIVVS